MEMSKRWGWESEVLIRTPKILEIRQSVGNITYDEFTSRKCNGVPGVGRGWEPRKKGKKC